jgi:hypothetical protein
MAKAEAMAVPQTLRFNHNVGGKESSRISTLILGTPRISPNIIRDLT